ncbi:MAG: KEOPS complex subunit Cgi121 [Methanothrix sp.]|jgi:KEOPS complex subunit Cgi121|uniref:KEOPS complex subunit Cgi121 n=1 Tax=Methanothrix sp. TaxID=90426 RepID=UPI002C35223E|nr:KEOPS complex subunit Cgi121 [Methanothrix sp.]
MNEIRLLFGRPAITDKSELISAIRDLQLQYGCIIQALDADKVVSTRHLLFATEKALSAFSQKRNIAKDAGLEILRYASGERQIEKAFGMGVSDRTERIALILARWGKECSWPDEGELARLLRPDELGCSCRYEAVKETFNISSAEIEAVGEDRLEDLVIERVALADTYR